MPKKDVDSKFFQQVGMGSNTPTPLLDLPLNYISSTNTFHLNNIKFLCKPCFTGMCLQFIFRNDQWSCTYIYTDAKRVIFAYYRNNTMYLKIDVDCIQLLFHNWKQCIIMIIKINFVPWRGIVITLPVPPSCLPFLSATDRRWEWGHRESSVVCSSTTSGGRSHCTSGSKSAVLWCYHGRI